MNLSFFLRITENFTVKIYWVVVHIFIFYFIQKIQILFISVRISEGKLNIRLIFERERKRKLGFVITVVLKLVYFYISFDIKRYPIESFVRPTKNGLINWKILIFLIGLYNYFITSIIFYIMFILVITKFAVHILSPYTLKWKKTLFDAPLALSNPGVNLNCNS